MKEIIDQLEAINIELFEKFGTDSYDIRCRLYDIREKLKSKVYGNT